MTGLLINASNLHVGGGVAVAASFIDRVSRDPHRASKVSLLISSPVAANLRALGTELGRFANSTTVDYHGVRSFWQGLARHFAGYDIVFTVFGPAYTFATPPRHVCGFAQPLIIFPRNPIERRMKPLARMTQRFKYLVQERFFARADELVVELEHVRTALLRKQRFRSKPIHIVYNTVDAVFADPARWAPVALPDTGGALRLGVVSRNYEHKNLGCLPELRQALRERHGLAVEFLVTFTEAEWAACRVEFRSAVRNVGALTLSQCPSFYTALDGVVFPSLLECFSATPLEAMSMRKPLFASDLPFIRDCCHEHAWYFDPLDVASMASTIAGYFQAGSNSARQAHLERAHEFVRRYPSAQQRADSYLNLLLGAPSPCAAP